MPLHVVALPGRHPQTEAWLSAVLSAVPLPSAGLVRYRHWTSDEEANVDFESGRLQGLAPDLVVAKSLGTVIAATAFHAHAFRPTAAVLIGTPYEAVGNAERAMLRQFADSIDTLFIQQTADPGGSWAALPAALALTRGRVADVPGSDHLYADTALLADIIRAWRT